MKQNNTMKAISLWGVFTFVCLGFSWAQSGGGYVTMRVFDCNKGIGMGSGYLQSKIIIVYEDNSTEEVELLPYNEKNELLNLKKVGETLNKLKAKGYFLITQTTTGEQGALITDYTLLKQE